MNPIKAIVKSFSDSEEKLLETINSSLYDVEINSLQGQPINLSEFEGKYILFVNVASKCGFTSQYKDLQKLYENYMDKLVVIGVPCNQFGNQEPGTSHEITQFCELNYGVTFLMTEKIDVKGSNQHPLYKWLTTRALNGKANSSVKWNFQKYLIDENGEFLDYFYSITKPLNSRITSYFN